MIELQALAHAQYNDLVRRFPYVARRLLQRIFVRPVEPSGYIVINEWDAGEIFATEAEAEEARKALVMRELQSYA